LDRGKGKKMNTVHRIKTREGRTAGLIAMGVLVAAISPIAWAKDKSAEQVSVIAHLVLAGAPVSRIFLQEESGRQYLYIQQPSREGFTIVDVTKPNKPNVIKRTALPNTAANGNFQMVEGSIAIAETPDKSAVGSAQQPTPVKAQASGKAHVPETIRVLDMSDPTNPRTLKTFDAVTSVLSDAGRHLIYITNNDGLWILRHQHERPRHLCDSEEVFSPIANCD
jgi:hypothetical protein